MLAPSGRLVSIGIASLTPRKTRSLVSAGMGLLKAPILHPYSMLSESKSLIGINIKRLGASRPRLLARALREVFDLVRQGRLSPHLDSVYRFEDCAAAHERLHGRQSVGKVVAFARAAKAAAMLREARVGMMGYRDMNLYATLVEQLSQ